MKTKQEQIEEMAKERNEIKDIMKLLDKCVSLNPMYKSEVASVLYGNNYRKAEQVRKETAKEILNGMLKKSYKLTGCGVPYHVKKFIKEFAEEYGVEVEE